jgi:hypothetical protein
MSLASVLSSFRPTKSGHFHYGPALSNYGKGTPVLFLVAMERTKGKASKTAIAKVESFLIQNAMKKNPNPLDFAHIHIIVAPVVKAGGFGVAVLGQPEVILCIAY